MCLTTRQKVQKLQQALHTKAKESPDFRFYALYDKLYRPDVLRLAYWTCHQNGGAPGVDGQTFADIEAYGEERWLGELTEELRTKAYRPQAVRRVYIPKPDGKQRPLGIPTIKDRVVQTAALLVLEPIFEADLQPEQYAYRPERSALDAVRHVHRLLNAGHREVVDADLSGYFDTIPHAELMKSVARRVSDKYVLHLLKMWLVAPVEERDGQGRTRRTTRNQDEKRGTPQGAPISPLLSNLYMRRFILGWKALGHARCLRAHIVNYADDFVICCRGTADEAATTMREMMQRLKLTVNETKTHVCRLPTETFDFLGYTFGTCYSRKTGRAQLGTKPSKQKVQRICAALSAQTQPKTTWREVGWQVASLNRMLNGWANYFSLGFASAAYQAVDRHARHRLRQWLRRKHKVRGSVEARYPIEYLHERLGLTRLSARRRSFPRANV